VNREPELAIVHAGLDFLVVRGEPHQVQRATPWRSRGHRLPRAFRHCPGFL